MPRILWAALFVSTWLYVVVLFVLAPPMTEQDPTFALVLGMAALSTASLSILLPPRIRRAALTRVELPIIERPDAQGVHLFRDSPAMVTVFADTQRALARATETYFTAFILGMALSEAVSLFGFMLRFLGYGWPYALPFFLLCWALMLSRFPTRAALVGPVEQHFGAKLAVGE